MKTNELQPDEYEVRVRCRNCGFKFLGAIKKGKTVHEALEEEGTVCPKCRCHTLEQYTELLEFGG